MKLLDKLLEPLRNSKGVVVTGPCFSLTARGTLAKTVTYSVWKGIAYAKEWFIPANPQSANQTNVRTAFTLLNAYWQATAVGDKALWDAGAAGMGMSGFDLYMQRGMDAYITQLGSSTTPASVVYTGAYPAEVWTWT